MSESLARYHLTLLGSLQLSGANPRLPQVRRKSLLLLAYLVLEDAPIARDTLADLFWPMHELAVARRNLTWTLSNLRLVLPAALRHSAHSVQFVGCAELTVDALQFRAAAADGSIAALQRAAALYGGAPLAGVPIDGGAELEHWLVRQQELWRQRLIEVLAQLIDACRAAGALPAALAAAERWTAEDPWRELAHRHVIDLLAQLGRREAALRHFEHLRALLARELSARPGAATVALVAQIRAAVADAPQPQLAARPTGVGHLPLPATRLLGRAAERERAVALLRDPDYRLVTLLGPGGIGKTHLAQTVGGDLHDAFADGVWFVPLATLEGTADAQRLALALLDALGARPDGSRPLLAQLVAYVSERDLLLILDNVEQIVDAAGEVSNTLLSASAGTRLLVTSRTRLGLRAEYVLRLDGLAPADGAALFLERAERAGATLRVTAAAHRAIDEICRLVEGVPLGIELAAAAVVEQPVEAIAAQLQDNLALLASPLRDVPERQRTLVATFNYAWQLLTPAQQRLLAGAATFGGSFSADAAAAILAAAPDALEALVDRSLLSRDASGRYVLHQLLARFAADQPGRPDVAQAFNRYYVDSIVAAIASYRAQRDEALLTALAEEWPNVQQAWWQLVQVADVAELSRCTPMLFAFLGIRGRLHDGRHVFGAALAALQTRLSPDDVAARRLLAMLAARVGYFLLFLGEYAAAQPLLRQALDSFVALDDQAELELPLTALYDVAMRLGAFDEALSITSLALARATAGGDPARLARALVNHGLVLTALDRLTEAQVHLEQGVALERAAGYDHALATALNNYGHLLIDRDDLPGAQAALREALALREKVANSQRIAASHLSLGRLALAQADADAALAHYQRALALFTDDGIAAGQAAAHIGCAQVQLGRGDLGAARRALEAAMPPVAALGETPRAVALLAAAGEYLWARGRRTQAQALLAWVAGHTQAEARTRRQSLAFLRARVGDVPTPAHAAPWRAQFDALTLA